MNHKVMCPSKHMKIVLLNLQDQYNREQLYSKEREKKEEEVEKRETVSSATQWNCEEGEPLIFY